MYYKKKAQFEFRGGTEPTQEDEELLQELNELMVSAPTSERLHQLFLSLGDMIVEKH